ncbi:MAG: glycosyltransferase family 2 protein [Deltaproteobacteria bacterium]|nr:glycosyltransferase family 2 protein [Deltaproteobacteria bacterium]
MQRAGRDRIGASLILPTRNRADVLRLSLPRFLDQTVAAGDYQIVVVDDASQDDTARVVRAFSAPNLIYCRLEKRSSAPAARNLALTLAEGRVLVFVDDDSLVRPDFLERHLAVHARHRRAVVSGPIVEVSKPPEERYPTSGMLLGRHFNPFPTGNASVERQLVVAAGGFDEDFQCYGWGDPELYFRLAGMGTRRYYDWRAPIYHYKPDSVRRDFFLNCRREESRGANGALFYAKHPQLAVGLQTKQLATIRRIDAILDRLLGLETRLNRARESGLEPPSAFWKWLLLNHVEVSAGRRVWQDLGPERRRDLAEKTRSSRYS